MKRQCVNILLTIILTFIGTRNSFACYCEGESTVSGSVKYADAVFSGEVISRIWTTNYDSLGIVVTGDTSKMYFKWREFPTAVVEIMVDKMYKGKLISETLTILTPRHGTACGYDFQVGKKYIVYATIYDELLGLDKLIRRTFDNKTYWTHRCTRTMHWNQDEENEIIKEIGQTCFDVKDYFDNVHSVPDSYISPRTKANLFYGSEIDISYRKILDIGELSIPFLIDQLTDTTKTLIYSNCTKAYLTRGDIALFLLNDIDQSIINYSMDREWDVGPNCGRFREGYFEHFQENRLEYQRKFREVHQLFNQSSGFKMGPLWL